MERACLVAGREMGWIVCPCSWRCARERSHARRTDGVSSEMLYSSGTPMRRGEEVSRDASRGVWRCEMIRERENEVMFVGSRASCLLRMAIQAC